MLLLVCTGLLSPNWVTILLSWRFKDDSSSQLKWLKFQGRVLNKEQHSVKEQKCSWGFKTWDLVKDWPRYAPNNTPQYLERIIWCKADWWIVTPKVVTSLRDVAGILDYSVQVLKAHKRGVRKTHKTEFKLLCHRTIEINNKQRLTRKKIASNLTVWHNKTKHCSQ